MALHRATIALGLMDKNKSLEVNNLGFTLIEIILVLTIISVIIAMGVVSYSQVLITSRDSTRKTDVQKISNALEQFKSNNNYGSYPDSGYDNPDLSIYISSIPTDPRTKNNYGYTPLPEGCTPSIDNPCTSYTLTAILEKGTEMYIINPY